MRNRFSSFADAISSLVRGSGTVEMRFSSFADAISSLVMGSGPLETRFSSFADAISSLVMGSGPLETRSASRVACRRPHRGGLPRWFETRVSIVPARDPMAAGFDTNAEGAKAEPEIAVPVGPGGATKVVAYVASEGQGRVSAPA